MHLCRTGAAPAALVFMLAAHPLAAQSNTAWLVGAGFSLPTGVFNSYANTGWDVTAGLEHALGNHPVALRLDLSYARNTDTTGIGFHEITRSINVMANVVYHFQGARPHLYALFGIGDFIRRFSSDDPDDPGLNDSHLAFQVGEGLIFRVRSATVFVEARFVTAAGSLPLQFFPLVVGVRFGAGKQ